MSETKEHSIPELIDALDVFINAGASFLCPSIECVEQLKKIRGIVEEKRQIDEDIEEGYVSECPYPCPLDKPQLVDEGLVEKIAIRSFDWSTRDYDLEQIKADITKLLKGEK